MDFKLELVVVPVSDVDRAREFYVDKMGFTLSPPTDDVYFVHREANSDLP